MRKIAVCSFVYVNHKDFLCINMTHATCYCPDIAKIQKKQLFALHFAARNTICI